MRPDVLKRLTKEELRIFKRIRGVIRLLPDIDLDRDEEGERIIISCHNLSRAVAAVFNLEYVDGAYASFGYDHSWVRTPRGHIIDVYPIGSIGGPLLLDGKFPSPAPQLYQKLSEEDLKRKYGDRFEQPSFLESVRRLTCELSSLNIRLRTRG